METTESACACVMFDCAVASIKNDSEIATLEIAASKLRLPDGTWRDMNKYQQRFLSMRTSIFLISCFFYLRIYPQMPNSIYRASYKAVRSYKG